MYGSAGGLQGKEVRLRVQSTRRAYNVQISEVFDFSVEERSFQKLEILERESARMRGWERAFLSSNIIDRDFQLVSMYEVGPVKCRRSLPQQRSNSSVVPKRQYPRAFEMLREEIRKPELLRLTRCPCLEWMAIESVYGYDTSDFSVNMI